MELIAALDDEDEAIIGRDEGQLIELELSCEQCSVVFGRECPRPHAASAARVTSRMT